MSSEQPPASIPGFGSAPQPPSIPPRPPASSSSSSSHQPGQQQQSYPQHLQADPFAMKLTRGTSCVLCQQRKVRCDKNKPCANCVKAGAECRVVPPQPPRRRKKRLQEKDLIDRLRRYESLLNQHGIKFDAIDQELRSETHPGDDVDDLENDFEGLKTSPEPYTSPLWAFPAKPQGAWLSLPREFRASEQLLHDSSDDEQTYGSTIHRALDRMFSNSDGFPFVIGGVSTRVSDYHPSTIHILQLWQIYIDNINPILKLTHVPSIQGKIIEATSNLEQAPKSIEALMFAIYLMALTSLEEAEVQRRFKDSRTELLGRYFVATQQALVNANFMRITDFLTLQAFVLYLFATRAFMDPRQVFCLTGIAIRIAQRMGLHRDPGGYGLPPLEVEQRRRLWWTIVSLDRRLGEITGSSVTAITSGCDCKKPLNVNDSDLHVDGKEPPTPHKGPTEMLFALSRIELSMAIASNCIRDPNKQSSDKNSPSSSQSKRPSAAATTVRLAGQDTPPFTIDGFCAHIEGTYLSHCDPKIPLHLLTLTMTRGALCKMRVISFLIRNYNAETVPLTGHERDSLLQGAIQMLEYDNVVQSAESLRPFRWFAMHHFPFPAYMFLVQELRHRNSGPLVERAWEAIEMNYSLRDLLANLHSPMHTVLSNQFVKAWLSYQEAQRSRGKELAMPHFICVLRDRVESRKKARLENRPDPFLSTPPVEFPRSRGSDAATASMSPENNAMMTPPIDQSTGLGATAAMPPSSTASGEEMDMDWSYLFAGYQDAGFQGFAPFGGNFPNPNLMPGGMGGAGMGGGGFNPGGGGYMFGN